MDAKQTIKKALETKWMTRNFNMYFYKLNSRAILGDCSKLFFLIDPKNYEDFLLKYLISPLGRSEEQLWEVAKKYKEISNSSLPLEKFYYNLIWHVIIQTFDGHKIELDTMKTIKDMGYDVILPDSEIDAKYAIDLIIPNKCFIQVKPISFILGNSNESLKRDRILALEKYNKALEKYNLPTYYIFYDKNKNFVLNKHKLCHKIQKYILQDGTSVFHK